MEIAIRLSTAVMGITMAASFAHAAVVADVRSKLSAGDLSSAEALVEDYHRSSGPTAEYAAAVTWLARGAVMMSKPEAAARHLTEAKAVIAELRKTTNAEEDAFLLAAVGASIEVEARLMSPTQAVKFLQTELRNSKSVALRSRIQKNINLLNMEGRSAPGFGAAANGKPLLLFFWAHWCGDCKAQAPVIAAIRKKYEPKGLVVIAPTRRYGQAPGIANPAAEQEDKHIEKVWKDVYAGLDGSAHPVAEELMVRYGVSSTPTLALVDGSGIVRMYLPARITEKELSRRIEDLLR